MPVYAVTIFLSAFLLFQIQPLIAKMILPWFGGSAAVWSASLLFFQVALLAGYAYAHFSIRFLKARHQVILHTTLLVASCALLPVLPSAGWRPLAGEDPTFRILGVLGATIGLQYFLLSSTSPLLQAWHARRSGSNTPYRLFALSNFGSLLALLTFPIFVEPYLTSHQQAYAWSAAYLAFAASCAGAAWFSNRILTSKQIGETAHLSHGIEDAGNRKWTEAAAPSFGEMLLWASLSACAVVLLISITNHMSENVAPFALLWVLPLALYLLTFILAFESDRIYRRRIFIPLLVPALGGMSYLIYAEGGNFPLIWAIPIFSAGLFVCCMTCHGELALRRPPAQSLTLFYLLVSLGGALAGIFVVLIAPRLFVGYFELEIALVACGGLTLIASWNANVPATSAWSLRAAMLVGVVSLAGYLAMQENAYAGSVRLRVRNFYGPLVVTQGPSTDPYAMRNLLHGSITHGSQFLDPRLRYFNTTYFTETSGVGRAIRAMQAQGPVRLGVIGLGTGTLANYSRKEDYLRVYEINPLMEWIAQNQFTFFSHSEADKRILLGDARLTLEDQEPQAFDLLAVDAFSGDAIPVHLLTREAMALYFRHLKPGGILAIQATNRYVDLEPVCSADAKAFGKLALTVHDNPSTWVLLTSGAHWFESPSFKGADIRPATELPGFRAWTDDYSSLVPLLAAKLNAKQK